MAESTAELLVNVQTTGPMLVLRGGERVLIPLSTTDVTADDAARIKDRLLQLFPDVQFALVTGVASGAHVCACRCAGGGPGGGE